MNWILKIWRLLPLTVVALALTACSSEDNVTEAPQTDNRTTGQVKTIAYSVTVGGEDAGTRAAVDGSEGTRATVDGFAGTRATVDGDNKTLRFAAGDVLYIASDDRADVKGALTLKAGDEGKTGGATFEGTLTYTGDDPADGLVLKATLVGASNAGISVTDGKVTGMAYPTAAYCTSVNDAVGKYSLLMGSSTYGARSFTLSQQTAFLNFTLTLNDGTETATDITVTVANGGATVATGTVRTTTADGKVKACFVLPVAAGTVLSGATVAAGSNGAVSFGGSSDKTLAAKVYNVSRDITAKLALGSVTAANVGWCVGSDGNAYYPTGALPTDVTAVAMICYVSSTGHGLALELYEDKGDIKEANLKEYYTIDSPTDKAGVSGCSWQLPSMDEWCQMIAGCNGESYTAGTYSVSEDACTAFHNMYLTITDVIITGMEYWTSDYKDEWNNEDVYRTYYIITPSKDHISYRTVLYNYICHYLATLVF